MTTLPIAINQNTTIFGAPELPEVIVQISARGQISLGPRITLTFLDIMLETPPKELFLQQPGLSLIHASPAQQGARLVLVDVVLWGPLCFNASDRPPESARPVPRPASEPGVQNYTESVPQTGCVNSTAALTWLSSSPSRVHLLARRNDFAFEGRYVDSLGTQRPNNYTVRVLNMTLLCRRMLTSECVAINGGAFGCYLHEISNGTLPPLDLGQVTVVAPRPTRPDGSSGSSDGPDTLAIVLGCVLGGVGLLSAVGLAVWWRHSGRGMTMGAGAAAGGGSGMGGGMGAGPGMGLACSNLAAQRRSPGSTHDPTGATDVVVAATPYQPSLVLQLQVDESGLGAAGADEASAAASAAFGAWGYSSHMGAASSVPGSALAPPHHLLHHAQALHQPQHQPQHHHQQVTPGPGAGGAGGAVATTGAGSSDVVTLLPVVRGRGAFGRVTEGLWRGQRVAVKQMLGVNDGAAAGQSDLAKSFKQEVEVLGRCAHPNVVKLFAASLEPPRLCLVMELCETSLERLLFGTGPEPEPVPLGKVLHIAMQICQGLAYLHPTIVHRDLKPANVLINSPASDRPTAKLTDFGLARMRAATLPTMEPEAGTTAYLAPECFDVENAVITHQADILTAACRRLRYSLGVVLWTMLAAREPWKDQSLVAVAFRVSQGQRLPLDTLGPERCPPKLRRLIESLWDHDPLRRPAAAEVLKLLVVIQEQPTAAHHDPPAA
eukprot:XP_001703195.1 predicted protein [Chlamydomonas reinhardtii]